MFKYNFNMKMQERFSVEDDYCLYLRKEFMKSMNSKLSDVDKILCNLIDPARRKFEEAEIGYPSYDFTLLDQEWENRLRT